MSSLLDGLRAKLDELRSTDAAIARWRALQLEILVAARVAQRAEPSESAPSFETLWVLLDDPFWVEADVEKLAGMVDRVLTELESLT
ncbi:MAG: hypothetical protein HOV81_21170 [Kofleriaceae bacterium]|nr:hypothetical protein [Kofleriaceae bacterium]